MSRSGFSEGHIAHPLQLTELVTPIVDVSCQIGASKATYFTYKKRFGDLSVNKLKHLKTLEDENGAFMRVEADLTLDKRILPVGTVATIGLEGEEQCTRAKRAVPAHLGDRSGGFQI